MKTVCAFLYGAFLGALFAGSMLAGVKQRGAQAGREAVIREAVITGNAVYANRWDDYRGFKWIVRKHSSQRNGYPNDIFVATDEIALSSAD